jgi:hypothetical protein
MKIVWTFLLLALLLNVSGLAVYFAAPDSETIHRYFWEEDSLVENMSAGTFFLAFLCGAALLMRGVRRRFDRRWLMLVTGLGLLGFLDEMSYGERLFDLKMPMVKKIKFDAIHDVIDWCYYEGPLVVGRHKGLSLLALAVAVSLVAIGLFLARRLLRDLARDTRNYPLYALMLCFVILLACAVTIDIGVLDPWSPHLPVVEELLEWSAAISLLFSEYFIYRGRSRG